MSKTRETMRLVLASIVATATFFAPMLLLGLFDMNTVSVDKNDSAQRGMVLAPVVFLVTAGIGHTLAVWLVGRGYTSLLRFTTGAFLSTVVVILVLAAPAVVIGSYIDMFSVRYGVLASLMSALAAAFMAVPASAIWWLVAGTTHNAALGISSEAEPPMILSEALRTDRLIEIVTIGARTGRRRTTEIWFTNIDGRIVICGTPSADGSRGPRRGRSWLANLRANPHFEFCFKESLVCCLPAKAIEVTDTGERRRIMSAPQTQWYRDQGFTVQDLVDGSPIVDVVFLGEHAGLNTKSC